MKFLTIFVLFLFTSNLFAYDPTRPKINTPKPTTQNSKKTSKQPLTGIFKKGNYYVAILDGDIYKSGDTFRGSRITKITRTYVQLSGAQGSRRLTLIASLRNQ